MNSAVSDSRFFSLLVFCSAQQERLDPQKNPPNNRWVWNKRKKNNTQKKESSITRTPVPPLSLSVLRSSTPTNKNINPSYHSLPFPHPPHPPSLLSICPPPLTSAPPSPISLLSCVAESAHKFRLLPCPVSGGNRMKIPLGGGQKKQRGRANKRWPRGGGGGKGGGVGEGEGSKRQKCKRGGRFVGGERAGEGMGEGGRGVVCVRRKECSLRERGYFGTASFFSFSCSKGLDARKSGCVLAEHTNSRMGRRYLERETTTTTAEEEE